MVGNNYFKVGTGTNTRFFCPHLLIMIKFVENSQLEDYFCHPLKMTRCLMYIINESIVCSWHLRSKSSVAEEARHFLSGVEEFKHC